MTEQRYRDRVEAIAASQRAAEDQEDAEVFRAILWVAAIGAVVIVALWVWL